MEMKLANSHGEFTDDLKNFSCAFLEGNIPVETYKNDDPNNEDPLFECVNDKKNTSVFINTREDMINICVKADNGDYYTTLSFEGEDYFKFMYLMKIVLEKNPQ